MVTMPDIPNQLLNEISDAIAIITSDYNVLYANNAFKKLFPFLRKNKLKTPLPEFEKLNLHRPEHHEPSVNRRLFLPNHGRSYEISVYLLNMSKSEQRCYLVMFRLGNKKGDHAAVESESFKDQFSDEKEIYSEKLSQQFNRLVGNDVSFRKALIISQRAAKSDLPVLITGESGTGKDVLVKAIHQTSHRYNNPLVDVNCAAIPDTLIESELFGYEKGSFTGASSDGRKGYFDEANGGTIFLDEIGDASHQTQSKLLRVLEDGCFRRVGGNRNINVDVRIISATNKNLKDLIAEHTFRHDLFYRLNPFSIHLPPLRERQGDIPLMVDYFLKEFSQRHAKNMKVAPETMKILQAYPWPGNVRELKGVVGYAVNMTQNSVISPTSLPNFLLTYQGTDHKNFYSDPSSFNPGGTLDLTTVVQHVEKNLIKEALAISTSRTEAIRALGISRRTFYLKIKQYGLA
jgi:transcriptional regulator with PAS, ATPase and Fis domain